MKLRYGTPVSHWSTRVKILQKRKHKVFQLNEFRRFI